MSDVKLKMNDVILESSILLYNSKVFNITKQSINIIYFLELQWTLKTRYKNSYFQYPHNIYTVRGEA